MQRGRQARLEGGNVLLKPPRRTIAPECCRQYPRCLAPERIGVTPRLRP